MAPHVFVEEIGLRSIERVKVEFETTYLAERLGRYHRDERRTFHLWNDAWLDPQFRHWNIEEYLPATLQLAATTLRSVLGKMELDDILAKRQEINAHIRETLDIRTEQWGVEITAVEIKDIALPLEMKRAIARQAEAERERRAKVIHAEGELQASEKLAAAAHIIGAEPTAIQLRYLSTLAEIATEHTNTIVFPIPLTLLEGLSAWSKKLPTGGQG